MLERLNQSFIQNCAKRAGSKALISYPERLRKRRARWRIAKRLKCNLFSQWRHPSEMHINHWNTPLPSWRLWLSLLLQSLIPRCEPLFLYSKVYFTWIPLNKCSTWIGWLGGKVLRVTIDESSCQESSKIIGLVNMSRITHRSFVIALAFASLGWALMAIYELFYIPSFKVVFSALKQFGH